MKEIKEPKYYKFQFNGDIDSCEALKTMINDGWQTSGTFTEDGYTWFSLEHWIK